MEEKTIQELINEQWNIIHDREAWLATKDYIGTKIAMGVSTIEEYADEIALTEQWRQELNAAKEEIKRLEALKAAPEDADAEGEESPAEQPVAEEEPES